jgi:hypothetical protein
VRGTAVTARVGAALGVAITICLVTGLISHFIQHPQPWFFWPTRPVWLYRARRGEAADHPSRARRTRRRQAPISRTDPAHGPAGDVACGGSRHGRHGGADDTAAGEGVGVGAAFGARAARGSGQPLGHRRRCTAQRAVTGLPVDRDERVDHAGVHGGRIGGDAAGDAPAADRVCRRMERRRRVDGRRAGVPTT